MPPTLESLHPPHLAVHSNPSHVPGCPIPGLMQHHDLLIIDLLHRAATLYPTTELISRLSDLPPTSPPHRLTYSALYLRTQRLAHALNTTLHIRMGDVVGTVAFNSHRHTELYFAVSGVGAVLHTINPRMPPLQLRYVIEHAQDTVLFVDVACIPLIQHLLSHRPLAHPPPRPPRRRRPPPPEPPPPPCPLL